MECLHAWVAGMMYVHEEDLEATARERAEWGGWVECEKCELVYISDQEDEVTK